MHTIIESLLVGNLDDVKSPPSYVTAVLFVAEEYDVALPDTIRFSKVPLKEFTEAAPEDLKRAIEWLEQHAASHRVMVCCRAGMGRSVSVVIAYLCCVRGLSYEDALLLVRMRRPGATPLPQLEKTIQTVQQLRQGIQSPGPASP